MVSLAWNLEDGLGLPLELHRKLSVPTHCFAAALAALTPAERQTLKEGILLRAASRTLEGPLTVGELCAFIDSLGAHGPLSSVASAA